MNKIILPLSPQQMVEFFKDKTQELVVDYDESLKNINSPKFLLMYIANMGLTCNIDKITDELLHEYITLTEFTNVVNLQKVHANLLMVGKYGEVMHEDVVGDFSFDQMVAFIRTYPLTIQTQMIFVDSIPLFLHTRKTEEQSSYEEYYHTNNISKEIGFSLMLLFKQSEFLILYLREQHPFDEQVYFVRYFDEYMFGGQNLFGLINNKTNSYMGLVQLITDAETNDDSKLILDDLTNKMNEMLATVQSYESA